MIVYIMKLDDIRTNLLNLLYQFFSGVLAAKPFTVEKAVAGIMGVDIELVAYLDEAGLRRIHIPAVSDE